MAIAGAGVENVLQCVRCPSPLGPLLMAENPAGLAGVWFVDQRHFPGMAGHWTVRRTPLLAAAESQVLAYLAGERRAFELPLAPHGTPFQRAVWAALRTIPYGRSASYGDIARALGRPAAARAVGAAVGRNPLSMIIPCHRVVGSNGALTGYAGGLARKRWLLAMEAGDARKESFGD
ncbi:MAG: methylated-DNA--[protein]-cysteine S-methyltransferase [Wenzhouxiangella sp.]